MRAAPVLILFLCGACSTGGEASSRPDATPAPCALFAQGLVSTPWRERDAALSPDGRTWMHTILCAQGGTIVMRPRDGDTLGPLAIAPFSGESDDLEPCFDPRGDRLWFASKRSRSGATSPASWNLWWVTRTPSGVWSEPSCFGAIDEGRDEFYPSVTRDGVLYFTAARSDALGEEDIYRVRTDMAGPASPENLGPAINSKGPEYNAFVAPDESYLIYSAERDGDLGRGDLRVSFRKADGTWTESVNLGPEVNSSALDYCPFVSPDGRSLFFTSNRRLPAGAVPECNDAIPQLLAREPITGSGDIYRVSMEVVMRLRRS
ncbi:MAG: hypothetical protein U1F36_13520 [Planctomycetota bacterium]